MSLTESRPRIRSVSFLSAWLERSAKVYANTRMEQVLLVYNCIPDMDTWEIDSKIATCHGPHTPFCDCRRMRWDCQGVFAFDLEFS